MKERFIVSLLVGFDWLMDFITNGRWSQVRGEERTEIKVK